jgi:hypothetical protein
LLSARLAIDIIFIALVIVAISITAVVVVRALADTSSQAQQTESLQQESDSSESPRLAITDPDAGVEETGEQTFEFTLSDAQVVEPSPADRLTGAIYGSWPFILPITWGAVGGTLVWRGKVRSTWSRQGYDYDTFRLVTKMRGSPTRIRLLNALGDPKNKLQLAKELEVDWKTIDNHIEMLLQSRLVEERTVIGTTRYYAITASGAKVLSLLSGDNKVGDS